MADGGKEVLNLAVICGRVADAIGGDHRQIQGTRDADRRLISPLFFALLMALQFDIDILAAEDARQLFDRLASGFFAAAHQAPQPMALRRLLSDRPGRMRIARDHRRLPRLALCGFPHLELRDELAKILIAFTRFAKQGQARRFVLVLVRQPCRRREPRPEARDRDLRSDVRTDVISLCAGVEAGRAVDAVVVEQRHCRHLQRGRPLDQALPAARQPEES